MKTVHYTLAILLLTITLDVSAQANYSAVETVRITANHMMSAISTERETLGKDTARLHALVEKILIPHVDFERMSRWVLGKHWRRANNAQRQKFTHEFKMLLIRTYATAMLEFSREEIDFLPVRGGNKASEVVVRTAVRRSTQPPIPINYSMHLKDGQWKTYDVTIDGISLVSNYRSSFASELRRVNLNQLIATLAIRNQKAAN